MPMTLGYVSAIVPELALGDVFALARQNGLGCVELMAWPTGRAERKFAGVTHVDVTDLTAARAEDILALAEEHDVSISALGYYPNPLDPDTAVADVAIQHLKNVIASAPLLGVTTVNSFVGRDWTKSIDENWPAFLRVWKPIVSFAEDQGVRIGIENCPMLFTRDEWPGGKNLAVSPRVWRRMFSDIPSDSFGLNYDPSHLVLQQMDPIGPLAEFKDKLFHLHAKDVRIDRARLNASGVFAYPLEWHQPRIPGYGEIDWARYMGHVTAVGYDGPVCIEVEDDTFGRTLDGRKRAVRVASAVLRPFFA